MNNDGFQYRWPETTGGTQVTLTCQGDTEGTASRLCNTNGSWEEPLLTQCTSTSNNIRVY